jgi:hypothetical protein
VKANGQPATKKDLAELEARLDAKLEALKEALEERIRDSQTELLKAFLPWQQSQNLRFQHIEVNAANTELLLKKRMEVLEIRLQEIEKRLLIEPPPPAS